MNCQACLTSEVERTIDADAQAPPYLVCNACAHRLENLALRPLEWFRLAAIHGPLTFLLNDDFYDESGKADQNRIPVTQASLFPAPELRDCAGRLSTFLDFALTRWQLKAEVVGELKKYPPTDVLAAMAGLMTSRPIPWVQSRCFEIAARAIGLAAQEWVEVRWQTGVSPPTLSSFLEAAAACLPRSDRTVRAAILAVEAAAGRDISTTALTLTAFRSPVVLEWIEQRVTSPVSDRWGSIASRSAFSWPTAARWLKAGRPLSLVALDALRDVYRRPARGWPDRPTELGEPPDRSSLITLLDEVALRDAVPRVTKSVEAIKASLQ